MVELTESELLAALRNCTTPGADCSACPFYGDGLLKCVEAMMKAVADRLDELIEKGEDNARQIP